MVNDSVVLVYNQETDDTYVCEDLEMAKIIIKHYVEDMPDIYCEESFIITEKTIMRKE